MSGAIIDSLKGHGFLLEHGNASRGFWSLVRGDENPSRYLKKIPKVPKRMGWIMSTPSNFGYS